jgi:hypothetical protein
MVALLIDGVHFAEHGAGGSGSDEHGSKRPGLREGATENAAAVRALLGMVERGLDPSVRS